MPNYQKMYTTLFNAITDTVNILQQAQRDAEYLYISADQPNLTVFKKTDTEENSK